MPKNDLRGLLTSLLSKPLWELQYDLGALLQHRDELGHRIRFWAQKHSPFYQAHGFEPVNRQVLAQAEDWLVSRVVTPHRRKTSGTTGEPLRYWLWRPQEIMLAKNNEILREFAVPRAPTVLKIKPCRKLEGPDQFAVDIHRPKPTDPLLSAGAHNAHTHVMRHHPAASGHDICSFVETYLEKNNQFDIFISSWSFMSTWMRYELARPLAKLLWTTCESCIPAEVEECRDRGYFSQFCDHMRCWDGGATFFTCQYGTYHCMDWLVDMDSDKKELVTTDYFNLASPFINYYNGDQAVIMKTWAKCQCGRYYRPMQFYGKRQCFNVRYGSFDLPSISINDVIEHYPVFIQAVCGDSHITIISDQDLTEEQKAELQSLLPVQMFFRVQEFYRSGTHEKLRRVIKV